MVSLHIKMKKNDSSWIDIFKLYLKRKMCLLLKCNNYKNSTSFIKILNALISFLISSNISNSDIFFNLVQNTFICELYIQVCTAINPMIQHLMVILEDPARKRKPSESLQMLQLYHAVRNLVTYVVNCIPTQRYLYQLMYLR